MNTDSQDGQTVRAKMAADVDAPDKVLYGLTFRQLAILAAAALVFYAIWRGLHTIVAVPILLGAAVIGGGLVFGLAVGRRDGLPMDVWLAAAIRHGRAPHALSTTDTTTSLPAWVAVPKARMVLPAPLRLPADAIADDGQIALGDVRAAIAAVTSVNLHLRTPDEQAALIDAYGRWLNSLSTPTQIVVSAQPVDLQSQARALAAVAARLPHPALTDACADHAAFLADLADRRDPLRRQILVVTRTGTGEPGHAARRRAEDTARALSGLGVTTRVLDGPSATAAIAAAADPYRPPLPGGLTAPHTVITAAGTATRPARGDIDRQQRTADRTAAPTGGGAARTAAGVAATVAPGSVQVLPRMLRVGDGYTATLVVTGYPAEVGPAWLEPLLSWPGRLDLALHIDPLPAPVAAIRLRNQRARFESSRRADADKGRLSDPFVEAAADDAADLAQRLARGVSKLFKVGLYLTVHARTEPELLDACAQVKAAAASTLIEVQPATWRHLAGWTTTLPLATDALQMVRTMDTQALAAAFPLASPDLPAPLPGDPPVTGGVLYGINPDSNGIVWWDRWACENHNSVVLACSGAGKSYFLKLEILRNLHHGVRVSVIDPEDEYGRLADAVGGAIVRLGHAGVKVNPLDLPAGDTRPDVLTRRGLFLHTLIAVMVGQQLPPVERAALDRAILTVYRQAGITADPATHHRPAPLLAELAGCLNTDPDPAAGQLAARLAPWVDGSFSQLFNGPSTTRADGHLVVWSLRHLPDEVRAVGTLLALDAIWRTVDTPGTARSDTRRLVVVDEAWLLMRDGAGARFLYRMAKAARKRNAGLTVVTQDVADVLGTDLGQAVVSNAATQILLNQSPQAITAVGDAFGLTTGERRLLLNTRTGQGLLVSGTRRTGFEAVASPAEHALSTTRPSELADLDQDDL